MNKEKFAQLLNGRQYGDEITREEEKLAREHGLLVCFGASDDLLEFRGIVYDEVGMYNGGLAFLVKKKGDKIDIMSEYDFNEAQKIINGNNLSFELPKVKIIAEWYPNDLKCAWRIKSDLPHATFDIMEDDELYCRGIVIEKDIIEQWLS